jgi:hypothetical protein
MKLPHNAKWTDDVPEYLQNLYDLLPHDFESPVSRHGLNTWVAWRLGDFQALEHLLAVRSARGDLDEKFFETLEEVTHIGWLEALVEKTNRLNELRSKAWKAYIEAFKAMPYADYLQTPHWKRLAASTKVLFRQRLRSMQRNRQD